MLQRIGNKFDWMNNRKLKENVSQTIVMVYEKAREQTSDIPVTQIVRPESTTECKIYVFLLGESI